MVAGFLMPGNEVEDRIHNLYELDNSSKGQHQSQALDGNWPVLNYNQWVGKHRQIGEALSYNLKNCNSQQLGISIFHYFHDSSLSRCFVTSGGIRGFFFFTLSLSESFSQKLFTAIGKSHFMLFKTQTVLGCFFMNHLLIYMYIYIYINCIPLYNCRFCVVQPNPYTVGVKS